MEGSMSFANVWRLGMLLNRRTRRRLLAANAGLALGVALVVMFVAAGLGLRRMVLDDLLGALPVDQIEVQTESLDLGAFRFGKPGILGGGDLDQEKLAELSAIDGVRLVHPIVYARFPVSIHGDVLGSRYGTDAPLQGVDPAWVADEVEPGYEFSADSGTHVPLLVSRKVLQAYNLGFAAANRLPRLTEKAVIGQEVTIVLGASSIAAVGGDAVQRPGRIVGFSDRIDALGVAVPLELIARYHARFSGEPLESYDGAVLVAESPGQLPRIERAVSRMGLEIAPESTLARQVGGAITTAILILSLVGLVVIGLAIANIANTTALILGERRFELGVVRAVGVNRRMLRDLLVGEAALSGLLSAIIALGLSFAALGIGAQLLSETLETVIGSAPRFPVPAWLVVAVILGAPLASFLASLVPAMRVTSPSIAAALRR
jgi:ABC-type antimicrobial peptide transport system permease subunit